MYIIWYYSDMSEKNFYVIIHNVRSCYNVGSILRTADALGVKKVYLTGYTPDPKDFNNKKKIKKTSLGAEETMPTQKNRQIGKLIKKLREQKIKIVALEQDKKSQNIFNFKPKFPLALIVGNEVRGVSKTTLKNVDEIVEIPMQGKKESLNVAVAFGVAGYVLVGRE